MPDATDQRNDSDVMYGHFARVVSGPHEGRYGVLDYVESTGKDGYPDRVIFRTRDDEAELLTVKYTDLRPAPAGLR